MSTDFYPSPKPKKPPRPAVKVYRDGREKCNQLTKAGRDEYARRKHIMWERQKKRCCLEGFIPDCHGRLSLEESVFEHEQGRTSGHRDDRIEVNGKWQNGAAHPRCNLLKASVRILYNDILRHGLKDA